jgi:hypothetical protein
VTGLVPCLPLSLITCYQQAVSACQSNNELCLTSKATQLLCKNGIKYDTDYTWWVRIDICSLSTCLQEESRPIAIDRENSYNSSALMRFLPLKLYSYLSD